ncbi:hypothetical protein B9R42_23200 [Arthrospira platensis PCC 7345]
MNGVSRWRVKKRVKKPGFSVKCWVTLHFTQPTNLGKGKRHPTNSGQMLGDIAFQPTHKVYNPKELDVRKES